MKKNKKDRETSGLKLDYVAEVEPDIITNPSFFGKIFHIIILSALFIIGIKLFMMNGENGLRINDLLGKPKVDESTSYFYLKILAFRFSEKTINVVSFLFFFFPVLMTFYWYLESKMTEFSINFRCITIKKGVINRNFDTLDLVLINDKELKRPWYLRPLGLSNLTIFSRDKTTPILKMNHIPFSKSYSFFRYIDDNAYTNTTEAIVARDKMRQRKGLKRRDDGIIDDGLDGNDE